MQKQIKEILNGIDVIKLILGNHKLETMITGISYNSKRVKQGNIFVCLSGQHTDGTKFVDEAIQNGAVAVVSEKEIELKNTFCPLIIVKNTVFALARLSTNFYDNPSKKMLLVGVTGTNGKTTITYILESIFKTAGYNPGVIGTINYRFNNNVYPAVNTTPFSSELQEMLFNMHSAGVNVVIMEVSSHSLVQGRVQDCEFDVAVFTNLSSEHLDYHKTMENYFEAKSLLFRGMTNTKKLIFENVPMGTKTCVVNIDNDWGKKLVSLCKTENVILYGSNERNERNGKNGTKKIRFTNVKSNTIQTQFEIIFNRHNIKISSPLIGEYNIYNVLASFAAAYSQNISIEKIVEGIKNTPSIRGRLEVLKLPVNYNVVIDYAHTPDALKNVLLTLKQLPHKRLIVVFGCGGDRDRSKRPVMGSIATELADYVILTSDNPRTEEPQKIILDIEVGIKRNGKTNYEIIIDRKEAIYQALKLAGEGDIILLAGKGHENYQIIGTEKIHFDEREIVAEAVSKIKN